MQRILHVVILLVVFSPLSAFARCGGLCLYEVGIPDQGASAAGQSARASDAATSYTNPAGMTRLEGHQLMLGVSPLYFDPQLDLDLDKTKTATPGETNEGGHFGGWIPLGGLHLVFDATERLKVGFTAGGSVGGSVDFDSNWIGRQYSTEAEVAVLELMPTAAFQVTDELSVGTGLIIGYGNIDFDVRPLAGPMSPTVKLEDGDDWGVTAMVGLLYEFSEDTRLGFVYRGPMDLSMDGEIRNPTDRSITFGADLDVPQGVNLALYQALNEQWALLADAGWTDWSDMDYQGLRIGIGEGVETAIPRNFKDTYRIGLGTRYTPEESPWLFRSGVSFDSSAISDSSRLPDIPADWTWRFSLGSEYDVTETVRLGASYTMIYAGDQEYDESVITSDGSVVLDGDTENTIGHAFGFTMNWVFG